MRGAIFLAVVLCSAGVVGCSDVLGIQDLQSGNGGGGGGGGGGIGSPDGGMTLPPHITFSGLLTSEDDGTPITDTTMIEALDANLLDRKVLATTTTTEGAFELDIPYNGTPIDVVVHAAAPNGKTMDTYQFFEAPLSEGGNLLLQMYSLDLLQAFASTVGVVFGAQFTMAEFDVEDDVTGVGRSGEIITVSPGGSTTYSKLPGQGPAEFGTVTSTNIDGAAWTFGVAPGTTASVAVNGATNRTYIAMPGGVSFVPVPIK